MSIIEQAARRLEELRRSGIEVPDGSPRQAPVPLTLAGAAAKAPARPAPDAPPPVATAGPSSRQVQIDLERLASMGYLTPQMGRSQIANEFRVIKRPLLNNLQGKSATPVERASLIMVTSSLPGEGKTFVSVNLAISLAMELDKKVLLVDADVSRPSILSRLGLPPAPGLLDLLTDGSLAMSDVLLRTNIENLALLPAGRPHGRATELLASDAMNRLLDEMAARYADRVLVFDAPPLLPSTESRVLATHMGQVVLVVEAEQTQEKTVAQTLATIESCPVVLPLLNKISRSEVGSYYGYYGPTEG
jgi:protein-tyrosine kinase